jgi:hypothetical protein
VAFDPADTVTVPPPIYTENDSLTQKPAFMGSATPPEYPLDLKRRGIHGRVVVQMVLDTLGRIEQNSMQVVTTPHPGFVTPVAHFLGSASFRPANATVAPSGPSSCSPWISSCGARHSRRSLARWFRSFPAGPRALRPLCQ